MNQGAFHESLNLAGSVGPPGHLHHREQRLLDGHEPERSSAYNTCLAERAEGYGIVWDLVRNGADIYEVRENHAAAIERAHKREPPDHHRDRHLSLLRHSVADAKQKGGYRTREEIENYKKNYDPIRIFSARAASAEGVINEERSR